MQWVRDAKPLRLSSSFGPSRPFLSLSQNGYGISNTVLKDPRRPFWLSIQDLPIRTYHLLPCTQKRLPLAPGGRHHNSDSRTQLPARLPLCRQRNNGGLRCVVSVFPPPFY